MGFGVWVLGFGGKGFGGLGVRGLGFGFWVLCFVVCGLWFGVGSLGFGLWNSGFRVVTRVSGFVFHVSGFRASSGFTAQGVGVKLHSGVKRTSAPCFVFRVPGCTPWTTTLPSTGNLPSRN